jgi:hypothetical protein
MEVERGEEERQRRLGDAGTGRHRIGERAQALAFGELDGKRLEYGTVQDNRRNRPVPLGSS